MVFDAKPNVGDSWRARWDSLELFTPRPFASLPGLKVGKQYSYYPKKDEIADYFESYASTFNLPILAKAEVIKVTMANSRYVVQTVLGTVIADHLIVATGPYSSAFVPEASRKLGSAVYQIHSSEYKSPLQIKSSSVVVVGGGNSATQLTEELHAAGKDITLISARMPWFLPKTILGISSYWWFYLSGALHAGADTWLSSYVRKRGNGIIGTNARNLIKNGLVKHIASRVEGASDVTLQLANGDNIKVSSVIWATGFTPSYQWLAIPAALSAGGEPLQQKGVSPVSGLYWVGLPWQTRMNSGIINGVGSDASNIVKHIKTLISHK